MQRWVGNESASPIAMVPATENTERFLTTSRMSSDPGSRGGEFVRTGLVGPPPVIAF